MCEIPNSMQSIEEPKEDEAEVELTDKYVRKYMKRKCPTCFHHGNIRECISCIHNYKEAGE